MAIYGGSTYLEWFNDPNVIRIEGAPAGSPNVIEAYRNGSGGISVRNATTNRILDGQVVSVRMDRNRDGIRELVQNVPFGAAFFDAEERDHYMSLAPVTIADPVVDPESGEEITTVGGQYGIGINTAIYKPTLVPGRTTGINTLPVEIGYYRQLAAEGDPADVFTIDFANPIINAQILTTFFYSSEGVLQNGVRGETFRYDLYLVNDVGTTLVSDPATSVVRAAGNGQIDFPNYPSYGGTGATNPGFFSANLESTGDAPFNRITITPTDSGSVDGTDFILEAIVGEELNPVDPNEDPTPGLIDVKPGSNPSSFNFTGGGNVPVGILTTDTLLATNVVQETIRLAFRLDAFAPNSEVASIAPSRVNQGDIDGDGDTDLVAFFDKADLRGIRSQLSTVPNLDPNNIPLFVAFSATDGTTITSYIGQNAIDDPVKVAGGL